MPAEIYQVWENRDGRQLIATREERERLTGQLRRMGLRPAREAPRLVDEFVACSFKEAVAFWRRIEQSRRPRSVKEEPLEDPPS